MVKITYQGFQAIRDETVLNIEGFTCITGESNRGKSSLVRGLKAPYVNMAGTDFITVGEDTCTIKQELNGHTLKWEKSKKGAVYTIDGKEYTKVGRSAPDELSVMGIREITTQDKKRHWPQIQGQQDPYFIVGEPSPATTAELIGANEDSLLLTRAIRLAKDDSNKAKSLEELLSDQTTKANEKLTAITPLGNLVFAAEETVDISFERKEVAGKRVDVLDDFLGERNRNGRIIRETAQIGGLKLPNPPDPERLKVILGIYNRWLKARHKANVQLDTQAPSFKLSPQEVIKSSKLEQIQKRLILVKNQIEATEPIVDLRSPNADLIDTAETRLKILTVIWEKYRKLKLRLSTLEDLSNISCQPNMDGKATPDLVLKLENFRTRFKSLSETLNQAQLAADRLKNEIDKQDIDRRRIIEELSAIDFCLLCGTELKPGQAKAHLEKVGMHHS